MRYLVEHTPELQRSDESHRVSNEVKQIQTLAHGWRFLQAALLGCFGLFDFPPWRPTDEYITRIREHQQMDVHLGRVSRY